MTIYLIFICVTLYLELIYTLRPGKQVKKLYCVIMAIVLTLAYTLRSQYNGLYDVWMNYVPMFKRICNQSFAEVINHGYRDVGFALFTKGFSLISNNVQLWFMVCSLPLTVGISKLIYDESKSVITSYALFFGLGYFGYNVFLMRQSIAMGFVIIAYSLYMKDKKKGAVSLVLVGALFHITALLAFAYPISRKIVKKFDYRVISIGSIVLFFVSGSLIIKNVITQLDIARFNSYLLEFEKERQQTSLTLFFIYFFLFTMMVICSYLEKENVKKTDNAGLMLLIGVSTGLLATTPFFGNIYRISIFSLVFLIGLIPNTINRTFRPQMSKIILSALTVLLTIYFFSNQIENQGIAPYLFFWGVNG